MSLIGYRAVVERALPGTIPELVVKSGMREPVVRHWLRVLRAEELCHIGDWKPVPKLRGSSPYAAEFVAGPGADALLITDQRDLHVKLVLDVLPATRKEIEIRTGLSKNTAFRIIEQLRDERCGWVRVCGWERPSKGQYMPRFSATKGPDVPCNLVHLTEKEKSQSYRNRARNTGAWADRNVRVNARNWANKAAARGDAMTNLLFGKGNAGGTGDDTICAAPPLGPVADRAA